LNQAVHGNGHRGCFEAHDPYVGKDWAERRVAVALEELRYHGHEGKEDADGAILENPDIDHLDIISISSHFGSALERLAGGGGLEAPRSTAWWVRELEGEQQLQPGFATQPSRTHTPAIIIPSHNEEKRTLNQVSPLLGTLNGPFSVPPVHFCIHVMGQTQFLGVNLRK
jgi:hypothetical protein